MFQFGKTIRSMKGMLSQVPGYRTRKRLVLFQSDDWGSLRVGTKTALKTFQKQGLLTDDPYVQLDTIASAEDLSRLFEILSSYKDISGHHPAFTANTNVANPDFDRIKENGFDHYIYEPFPTTIERLGDRGDVMTLWKEGIENGVFKPQYHGREHLNVAFWMRALKDGHRETLKAFRCNAYGVQTQNSYSKSEHYLAAFDFHRTTQIKEHAKILSDGVELFRTLFGFTPLSFMAPQYIWHPEHEKILSQTGARYIQGNRIQKIPLESPSRYRKVFHYTGQVNANQQIYLIRNCIFEPALGGKDWVDSCLQQIRTSFIFGKPAIISTHRLNYVSKMSAAKAAESLIQLRNLLDRIMLNWPDVTFLFTDELGERIEAGVDD